MIASTIIIAAVASFVINKFMMKKYGKWDVKYENCQAAKELAEQKTLEDAVVNKGLRNALFATIIYWGALFLFVRSIIVTYIIPFMMFFFIAAGLAYGVTVKTIKNTNDFVKAMENGLKSCLSFLVIAFPIANAIEAFGPFKHCKRCSHQVGGILLRKRNCRSAVTYHADPYHQPCKLVSCQQYK